jgi:hypothetical protein
MKQAFCTITTQSHLFKVKALFESLSKYPDIDFFCLITDSSEVPNTVFGEQYHTLGDLNGNHFEAIKRKYKGDKLRWSFKPVYIKHLLQNGYNKVIYCDNDIFFFDSPQFLFEKLDKSDVLLTPHWYPHNPQKEQNWLEANFRVGLYNAGFFAANQNSIKALDWWSECCIYNVKKAFNRGMFDDQKYLDLMPVVFENVEVLKHKGCNVAGWNTVEFILAKKEEKIFINEKFPLVFIHFTPLSFREFSGGKHLLAPYLAEYLEVLIKHNPDYSFDKELARTHKDYFFYLQFLFWKLQRLIE